jgi:uncharacterized repeat protein (TIGR04138 family)
MARTLTGDLLCIKCSYNLRGLPLETNCPECGETVRRTWNAARRGMYPGFRQVAHGIFRDWLSEIARRAGIDANGFFFVMEAISFTRPDPEDGNGYHAMAADICTAVGEYANVYFNSPHDARKALEQWNVRTSEDVGAIVFALVDAGFLRASPGNSPASFNGLFTFEDLIGGVLGQAEPA